LLSGMASCFFSQMAMQSSPNNHIRRAEPALQKCTFDLELELLDFSSLCERRNVPGKLGRYCGGEWRQEFWSMIWCASAPCQA